MSRTGKPQHLDRPKEVKLSIPGSILAEVELLCENPVTQRPIHGLRGALTTELYRAFLRAYRSGEPQVDLSSAFRVINPLYGTSDNQLGLDLDL